MPTGQCYCGRVRYEFDGELGALVNCHCRFCRRAHGAAFATAALLPSASLRFTSGQSHLRRYETSEGFRCFCELCGGRLYNQPRSNPDILMLLVTSLDDEPQQEPVMHINLESKAPWYRILDDLPQHQGLPPAADRILER